MTNFKIAFASCMHAINCPSQPVWKRIAETEPDVLVLLGDAIYLDVDTGRNAEDIQRMGASEFASFAHGLYRRQLAVPEFAALLRRPHVRTYAIWDDHDFMFNNACGAEVERVPAQADKIEPARALFNAFRATVESGMATAFPAAVPAWAGTPAPGYRSVPLPEINAVLHVTDGRSFKARGGKKALLGTAQMDAMHRALQDAATSMHLIASGVVFEDSGECWAKCATEHSQLLAWAGQYKILMLSGDIHKNRFNAYGAEQGRHPLFNAVSSGAALKGILNWASPEPSERFGLLSINADTVTVQTYQAGTEDTPTHTIQRTSWSL